MQIGAIGSVSAMSYTPYIYNTNRLSSTSLDNKISPIKNDTASSKTDFSDLTTGETTNPLGRGQTSNFVDVLAMQFSMAQNNASKVMSSTTDTGYTAGSGAAQQDQGSDNLYKMSQAADAYSQNITA